jgi:hypothetical protein
MAPPIGEHGLKLPRAYTWQQTLWRAVFGGEIQGQGKCPRQRSKEGRFRVSGFCGETKPGRSMTPASTPH